MTKNGFLAEVTFKVKQLTILTKVWNELKQPETI